MHDDQRPYESATDLFCIEPRQDDQPEDRAVYWSRIAGAALREAHDARFDASNARREWDAADRVRSNAEERCTRMQMALEAAEDRLAMLHDVAVLAADSKHRGDTFNYGLQVGLILNNLAPLAVRPADDIALRATADALASFHASDNDVCTTCDGGGWVTDGDDRQTRCPECQP